MVDRPHEGAPLVYFDPAAATLAANRAERHHVIAGINELIGVEPKPFPDFADLRDKAPQAIVAEIRVRVGDASAHVQHTIRMEQPNETVDIPIHPGPDGSPHDLHIC